MRIIHMLLYHSKVGDTMTVYSYKHPQLSGNDCYIVYSGEKIRNNQYPRGKKQSFRPQTSDLFVLNIVMEGGKTMHGSVLSLTKPIV